MERKVEVKVRMAFLRMTVKSLTLQIRECEKNSQTDNVRLRLASRSLALL